MASGHEILVDHLSLRLRNEDILQNIQMRFASGHIYGLVGRNGSGKSMLMTCISGFLHATSGRVLYDGRIVGVDVEFLPDMGVIIATPGFISCYSGFKNVKLLAGLKGNIGRPEIQSAMEAVGLDPDAKKTVGAYSLGMRQRLGIAQAIMEEPDVLILDEPFNGLDTEGVHQIRELIKSYNSENHIIILASHIEEDIRMLCDTVLTMEKGTLKSVTSPQ